MSSNQNQIVLVHGARHPSDLPGFKPLPNGVSVRFAADEDAFEKQLPDANILLSWNFKAEDLQRFWSNAKSLQWIHWCGAGVDAALFPELVHSDVILTNSRGIFNRAMAEYVLGYLLFESKNFRQTITAQRDKTWNYSVTKKLSGQNAVVFGSGGIGKEIGLLLKAVDINVIGVARSARKPDQYFDKVVALADCESVLANADWVIGILPSTEDTLEIFNAAFFKKMKPGSQFINLGRGDAVDESALATMLKTEHLSGAMLDVFQQEPLSQSSDLWDCPNLFISPHMSGDYQGFQQAMVELFFNNLELYLGNKTLENIVDKQLGFIPGNNS